jgi:hypothetical protein
MGGRLMPSPIKQKTDPRFASSKTMQQLLLRAAAVKVCSGVLHARGGG